MIEGPPQKMILIVDDDADISYGLAKILSDAGYKTHHVRDGLSAMEKILEIHPDLVLLDIMLPGLDGKQIRVSMSEKKETAEIPVIFLSAKDAPADKVEGLRLQPDDYINKPFDSSELLARIDIAIKRHSHYEKLALSDGLSGVSNFRAFQNEFEVLFGIAKRYHRPFAVGVLDIDDLKKINDVYGHSAGDEAIKQIAAICVRTLRAADRFFRYGGDEFAILFPECSESQALGALRRCQQEIASQKIVIKKTNISLDLAVSAGVAAYKEGMQGAEEMFNLADDNMYQQKKDRKSTRESA